MDHDDFDNLSEAEARALLRSKAQAILTKAREVDALQGWAQRRFGIAFDVSPLHEALATMPDADAYLTTLETLAREDED